MVVPVTSLRFEVPYSPVQDNEHAEDIIRSFRINGEQIIVAEDEVIAGQRLLEALIHLGFSTVKVVREEDVHPLDGFGRW